MKVLAVAVRKKDFFFITYLSTGSVAAISAWPWHLKYREGLFYCTDTTTMDKRKADVDFRQKF